MSSLALAAPQAPAVLTVEEGSVVIDGVLDEDVWARATPIDTFQRFTPTAGRAPAGSTEVRFLQDDRYLYVGIRITEADYRIRARISPREDINSDDQVGIYLDTFLDGRSGYVFYLNPLGIQQDARFNNASWNGSWDTAFRSRGRVTDDGYEIEVAYPWRSLKYRSGTDPQTWGLILTRKIPSEGAKYAFPEIERNHPRLFSQEAVLPGVLPAPRGSGLELIPQLTAMSAWPGHDGRGLGHALRPSLDGRLGITPDIGLAAAINPDFSHVESDVADVRLNPRFAFRFPERRPFFLDGIDFYEDRVGMLYTRSIHEPLYGAKISGREGPWSVGVLNALDRAPLASFHERQTPGFTEEDVAGRYAMNSVARVRADAFGKGYLGVSVADKRILGTPEAPGDRGTFDAVSVDGEAPLPRRWIVSGSALQTAWAPNPTDRPRFGTELGGSARRASGIGWGGGVEGMWRSDDVRVETGFINQSGIGYGGAHLDYTFEPEGVVDTWTPGVSTNHLYETDGDHLRDITASQRLVIGGIHALTASASAIQQREGAIDQDGWSASLGWTGQIGRVVEFGPSVSMGRHLDFVHFVPADTILASGELSLRPTAGIRLDTTARWQRLLPAGQPVAHAMLIRERLHWQFSRTLGLRLIGEWTDGTDRVPLLRTQALLTWLDVPGTAVHLGWSETTALGGETGQAMVDRTVFAKVSVLLRP